jgi:hypothetical protein
MDIVIAPRFAGPPRSGNGGYTCGLPASVLSPAPGAGVRVTLRRPPPLATPMQARAIDVLVDRVLRRVVTVNGLGSDVTACGSPTDCGWSHSRTFHWSNRD